VVGAVAVAGCTATSSSKQSRVTATAPPTSAEPVIRHTRLLVALASSSSLAEYRFGRERWHTTEAGQPQAVAALGRGWVALVANQVQTRAIFFVDGSGGPSKPRSLGQAYMIASDGRGQRVWLDRGIRNGTTLLQRVDARNAGEQAASNLRLPGQFDLIGAVGKFAIVSAQVSGDLFAVRADGRRQILAADAGFLGAWGASEIAYTLHEDRCSCWTVHVVNARSGVSRPADVELTGPGLAIAFAGRRSFYFVGTTTAGRTPHVYSLGQSQEPAGAQDLGACTGPAAAVANTVACLRNGRLVLIDGSGDVVSTFQTTGPVALALS
jgi:hypothetical protein